jgi:hypothetical protein
MKEEIILKVLLIMLSTKGNKDYTKTGLCLWIGWLHHDGFITEDEYLYTKAYIMANRPKLSFFDNILYGSNSGGAYYWKKGAIRPRVAWIKKHINSLCKQIDNEKNNPHP